MVIATQLAGGRRRRFATVTPLEMGCAAAWVLLIAIDTTLFLAAKPFVSHPYHSIALVGIGVISSYALCQRALRPVRAQLDALSAGQRRGVQEITGELPRASTDAVRRLAELVEASDRDRDLIAASLHDEIARARADAQEELRASMRWVFKAFEARGIDPTP